MAHRARDPIHRLVGQLHGMELALRPLRGDECPGGGFGVPGDDRVRRNTGQLTANRKSVRFANYCIHGQGGLRGNLHESGAAPGDANLRESLIATLVTPRFNGCGRYWSSAAAHGSGPNSNAPDPRGELSGERRSPVSNLRDTVGLCIPYGKADSQYETEFEPATATLWGYFNPNQDAPCFSLGLLKDIASHDEAFARDGGHVEIEGRGYQANHYVLASRTPRVFNMGGDLALFSMLIKSQDRHAIGSYAKLCIDNMYRRIQNFRSPTLTTISLVQGDALGGSFEAALSSDVIIAEESE